MFLEIDVTAGENSPITVNRMFDLFSPPRVVRRIFAADQSGQDRWLEVSGWSSQGVCPAKAALAEDSGEGLVLLVYGGDQGIRLRVYGEAEEWDVANPSQWGEACLMLDRNAPVEE
ncbi:MAG: hypothetical protein FJ316_11905 [SAR202 cluster bacterium]|nr:hypothetical protein [SAR202 cluster bacterium]